MDKDLLLVEYHDQKRIQKLLEAYWILAELDLADHTYTHLSMRSMHKNSFFTHRFGFRFEELSVKEIVEVFIEDAIKNEGVNANPTAHLLHGAILKKQPHYEAIIHLHTPSIVAVSALEEGLMPLSQWALHVYSQVAYYPYDSLLLHVEQSKQIVKTLGEKTVLLMRHHGAVLCGKTIEEALFFAYHLEKACVTQCLALGMGKKLLIPNADTCKKAFSELTHFEDRLGERDWNAWVRWMKDRRSRRDKRVG